MLDGIKQKLAQLQRQLLLQAKHEMTSYFYMTPNIIFLFLLTMFFRDILLLVLLLLIVVLGLRFPVFHGIQEGSRKAFVSEMSRKPFQCSLLNENKITGVILVKAKEMPSTACMRDCCKGSFKLSSRYLYTSFYFSSGLELILYIFYRTVFSL